MKRGLSLYFLLTLLAGMMASWTPLASAQEGKEGHDSVMGTWFIQVPSATGLTVCSNGAPVAPSPPPFVQLATFAAGGTYTETNSVLNFNTASSLGFNGSDGHGAWKAQGAGHYKLTFRKLLYTSAGEYAGNADLNDDVTVGDNTITGTFTVMFSLPKGTPLCASGQLSLSGSVSSNAALELRKS